MHLVESCAWASGPSTSSAEEAAAATARAAGAEIICGVDAWSCATDAYAANFREAKAVNLTLDANHPLRPGRHRQHRPATGFA